MYELNSGTCSIIMFLCLNCIHKIIREVLEAAEAVLTSETDLSKKPSVTLPREVVVLD